jgi:MFS family permease
MSHLRAFANQPFHPKTALASAPRPSLRGRRSVIGPRTSAFDWSYALFQAPGGWMADRFGSRIGLASAFCLFSALLVNRIDPRRSAVGEIVVRGGGVEQ